MTDTDSFEFVHDAELVGLRLQNNKLHLAISTEDGSREITLHEVDRLVAMTFLFGNVIYKARTIPVQPDLPLPLEGISEELSRSFFDIYGLTPAVLSKYQGTLFVLESSVGCELLCAFKGTIEVK